MLSTVTLSLAIAESRSVSAAYAYGAPSARGARIVRASYVSPEGETTPLVALAGTGRGRGSVVSFTLYVTLPADVLPSIPGARPLDSTDGRDRTREGKREGYADYLFEITREEYAALVTTLNPATALVAKADIPTGEEVFKTPGIAIPTRYAPKAVVGETPSEAPTLPSDIETPPTPTRAERRKAKAIA